MVREVAQFLGVCILIVLGLWLFGKSVALYGDVMRKWGRVPIFSRRHLRRSLVILLGIFIFCAIVGLIFFVFMWPVFKTALR